MVNLLLLHTGAGKYRQNNVALIEKLIKKIFKKHQENHGKSDENSQDHSNDEIFKKLLIISRVLEESPLTNTGYGSSITKDCEVYCDSTIAYINLENSKNYYSSVVCNSSLHPIEDAIGNLSSQFNNDRNNHLGITRPIIRIGNLISNDNLVTPKMKLIYEKYINSGTNDSSDDKHDKCDNDNGNYNDNENDNDNDSDKYDNDEYNKIEDTIGILIVNNQKIVVSSSSGGNLLKEKGRIGCAGVIGSSCFTLESNGIVVSVMCSGNGEDIIQMDLARTICRSLIQYYSDPQNDHNVMVCDLVTTFVLQSSNNYALKALDDDFNNTLYVGVVGYLGLDNNPCVFYFHTTEQFLFAFKSANQAIIKLSNKATYSQYQRGEYSLRT